MACCLDGAKPLSEPMLKYCGEQTSVKFQLKFIHFHCLAENGGHFCLSLIVLTSLMMCPLGKWTWRCTSTELIFLVHEHQLMGPMGKLQSLHICRPRAFKCNLNRQNPLNGFTKMTSARCMAYFWPKGSPWQVFWAVLVTRMLCIYWLRIYEGNWIAGKICWMAVKVWDLPETI